MATLRAEDVPDDYLGRAQIFELTESVLRSPASRTVALELARRASILGCEISINPNFRVSGLGGWRDRGRWCPSGGDGTR